MPAVPGRLLTLAALCAGLATAAPGPADAAGDEALSFAQLRDQGVHYLRRELYAAARDRLELALRRPGGEKDFVTHLALGKVYYRLVLLEEAFAQADAAVEHAGGGAQVRQAEALLHAMEDRFGAVTLVQAEPQRGKVTRGFVYLEDRGGLINRTKKEAFQRIRDRLAETPVSLPLTVYLPFGRYAANLAPFEIRKGKVARVETLLDSEPPGGDVPWLLVGAGVAVAGAAVTAAVLLAGGEPPTRELRIGDVPLEPRP